MVGGTGDDQFYGGKGRDTYSFKGLINEGLDLIRDFKLRVDKLQIEGISFDDLMISGIGEKHTLISYDAGTEIRLENVALGEIAEDDFQFI